MICSNHLVDEEDYLFVINRKKDSPVECIVRVSDMVCVSGKLTIETELRATAWVRNYYLNINK